MKVESGEWKAESGKPGLGLLSAAGRGLRDLYSGVMDLIYPPHCVVCRDAGDGYLCPKCADKITLIKPPVCYKCGKPCEASVCDECYQREYAFECARSAGIFDGPLRDAIHAMKYRNYEAVVDPLAQIMIRAFPDTGLARNTDVLVPIPIHYSRLLDRGFNQSEELARKLAGRIGLPMEAKVLRKSRKTAHQVDLPLDERALNVRGSLSVKHEQKIRAKRVLLIDDVFTTGATLDEAARVLLEAGASEVRAYTLARSL